LVWLCPPREGGEEKERLWWGEEGGKKDEFTIFLCSWEEGGTMPVVVGRLARGSDSSI
jgi:hypothetical protein